MYRQNLYTSIRSSSSDLDQMNGGVCLHGVLRLLAIILVSSILAGCGSQPSDTSYAVSGCITKASDNSGLEGVTLGFSGGRGTATTGSEGTWAKSGLRGNVIISPAKEGWIFTPSSSAVSVNQSNVDFLASQVGSYAASGHVKDLNGDPIQGVTIELGSGLSPITTGPDGGWAKLGLVGTVTASPKKKGWTFAPNSIDVSGPHDGVNFTGTYTSPTYSASGKIADQHGKGIADVLLFLSGGFGTAGTAADGSWSANGLSGTITITPAKPGLEFTPATITVSGSSTDIGFVGAAPTSTYTASGSVVDGRDGTGMQQVSFTFSRGFGRTQSNAYGDWSKSGLHGTVTVTPSRPGWRFVPESKDVSSSDTAASFTGWLEASTAPKEGGR